MFNFELKSCLSKLQNTEEGKEDEEEEEVNVWKVIETLSTKRNTVIYYDFILYCQENI